MRYYDLKRNWRRVKPHLNDPMLNKILVCDMHKYRWGRNRKNSFVPGMFPCDAESTDWRFDHPHRWPAYWQYVCMGACFWLVNFNLRLAMLVEPKPGGGIVESTKHATGGGGEKLLFEFNFQAFGIPPEECFRLASASEYEGITLKVGRLSQVYCAEHWRKDPRINGRQERQSAV